LLETEQRPDGLGQHLRVVDPHRMLLPRLSLFYTIGAV
jgi:hypothetical protein